MRYEELPETVADNQVEGEAGKKDLGDDLHVPPKIPFKIDEGIVVRSLTNTAHIAKSRIIGARAGDYVLITEPTVRINERLRPFSMRAFYAPIFATEICTYSKADAAGTW